MTDNLTPEDHLESWAAWLATPGLAYERDRDVIVADLRSAAARIRALSAEVASLKSERDRLRDALADAIQCLTDWAVYADPYFQDKHDLHGAFARITATLEGKP
jgi:hypothetical protein